MTLIELDDILIRLTLTALGLGMLFEGVCGIIYGSIKNYRWIKSKLDKKKGTGKAGEEAE